MIHDYFLEEAPKDEFFAQIDAVQNDIQNNISQVAIKKQGKRGRPKGERNSKKECQKQVEKDFDENKNKGHWSFEERKKYHWFLEIYSYHFLNKHLRRADKIFKTMQTFIGTRQAEQCRSHHQKMQKKHKNFKQILLHLRNLNYGTEEHTVVAQDILKNKMELNKNLITEEQLHQEQNHQTNNGKQQKQYGAHEQNNLLQEQKKTLEDMFSDKYENQIHFRINKFL